MIETYIGYVYEILKILVVTACIERLILTVGKITAFCIDKFFTDEADEKNVQ